MTVDWGAGSYERIAEAFAPVHDHLAERLDPRPGERWLDVATGTGELAVRAARAGAQVTGVDITEALLAQARAQDVPVTWDLGDAQALPYADASFDVVCSNFGVPFAPDHLATACELARVCRPAGRLGLTAWRPDRGLAEVYRPFADDPAEGREPFRWGDEDYVEALLGGDFELSFERRGFVYPQETGEEIWELMTSSAPPMRLLVESIDDERREGLHRAFVEYYDLEPRERPYLLTTGRKR